MTASLTTSTGVGADGRRDALAPSSFGSESVLVVGVSSALLAAIAGFFWMAGHVGPDLWVPVLLATVLVAVSVPVCLRTAGPDQRLRRLLVLGLCLKLVCVAPRYLVNEVTYGGSSDASMYHEGGSVLRANVLDGEWSLDGAFVQRFPSETQFVAYLTGAVYLVTGTSPLAAYVAFAWIGWIGLFAMFRAFRLAYPNAPPHLAATLLFFLPSLLYWPSSLGKDALMLFGLGLVVLGVTHLVMAVRVLLGALLIALGAYPIFSVRPHLLLIVIVGGAASLISSNASGASTKATIGRGFLLVALVPALFVGLARMDQTFGQNGDSGFTVTGALAKTSSATSIGGSAFATKPIHTPLDVPVATVNVLYRPFLFEATSVPSLISALEGTALLVLTIVSARWLWRIGPAVRRHPLAGFCAGYVLAFVFAFANVGNAGILARQRIQLFPVLMLLVAATAEARRLAAAPAIVDLRSAPDATPSLPIPEPRLVPFP